VKCKNDDIPDAPNHGSKVQCQLLVGRTGGVDGSQVEHVCVHEDDMNNNETGEQVGGGGGERALH
jgi:hypothetical protein